MFEGQFRQFFYLENLQIFDENNLSEVKVFVVDGVRYGYLQIFRNREYFIFRDFKDGIVFYKYDGIDIYSDNIIFRMIDGKYDVEFLFFVIIYLVDDEFLILNKNFGFEIKKGDIVEVNRFVLGAIDIDSEDVKIFYLL